MTTKKKRKAPREGAWSGCALLGWLAGLKCPISNAGTRLKVLLRWNVYAHVRRENKPEQKIGERGVANR